MITTTTPTIEIDEGTMQAVEAFTGTKLPRAKLLRLLSANEVSADQ